MLKWFLLIGFDVVCFLADVGQEEDCEEDKDTEAFSPRMRWKLRFFWEVMYQGLWSNPKCCPVAHQR
jgi:argininosuccinate synthase